jgi:hypothetical protein
MAEKTQEEILKEINKIGLSPSQEASVQFIISEIRKADIEAVQERIGQSHNLDTEYETTNCELGDCSPTWDGNFYTCRFCGKEFIKKDSLLSHLSKLKDKLK